MKRRGRATATFVAVALGVGLVGVVGFVAGRSAVSTSPPTIAAPAPLTVTIVDGTLTDSSLMNIVFQWVPTAEIRNQSAGMVTRTEFEAGTPFQLEAGVPLYWVDETPVVAMPGSIPAFRALSNGMSGLDVEQVQSFLASAGFYKDAIDGRWRATTTDGVKAWQRSLGLPVTGSLPFGAVAFVPSLPIIVSAESALRVGTYVDVGTTVVNVLAALPSAKLLVPVNMTKDFRAAVITATFADKSIEFRADGQFLTDPVTGQTFVELSLAEPTASCSGWCDEVSTSQPLNVQATATFAGPATGALVPLGALRTEGDTVRVTMADGSVRSVQIVLQVDGQAIVEGVVAGEVLLVPGVDGS